MKVKIPLSVRAIFISIS